jgi:hypothetical protein
VNELAKFIALLMLGLTNLLLAAAGARAHQQAIGAQMTDLIISPSGPIIVESGSHRQFTANAIGMQPGGVHWSIEGDDCAQRGCGSVSSDGFYAAPNHVSGPLHFKILARETAKPFLSTSEEVTVVPSKSQHRGEPCKSSEPGYCNLGWQIHQALFPFVW